MEIAKVFTNGGSQAVRLPKGCRFVQDEVLVNRIGSVVILMPKDDPWSSMLQGFSMSRCNIDRKISAFLRLPWLSWSMAFITAQSLNKTSLP